jgi:hypothetical protein
VGAIVAIPWQLQPWQQQQQAASSRAAHDAKGSMQMINSMSCRKHIETYRDQQQQQH